MTYYDADGNVFETFIERTKSASRAMVLSLFPSDPNKPESYGAGYYDYVMAEGTSALSARVLSASAVKVGDLILVVAADQYRGEWRTKIKRNDDVAAVVGSWNHNVFAKVTKVTAKSFEYVTIGAIDSLVGLYSNSTQTITFATDSTYTTRTAGTTQKQDVLLLGTVEDFETRLLAHPDYAKIAADRAKAFAIFERYSAMREAVEKAKADTDKALRAPFTTAAKAIQAATGFRMFDVKNYGRPSMVPNEYLTGSYGDIARLAIYGRLHLAEITNDQAVAALTALGDFDLVEKKG